VSDLWKAPRTELSLQAAVSILLCHLISLAVGKVCGGGGEEGDEWMGGWVDGWMGGWVDGWSLPEELALLPAPLAVGKGGTASRRYSITQMKALDALLSEPGKALKDLPDRFAAD